MSKTSKMWMGIVAVGLSAACSTGDTTRTEVEEIDEVDPVAVEQDVEIERPEATRASDLRVRLEKARRSLDRGEVKAAEPELESLAELAEAGDDKNEVLLALSRAYEANGDLEGAVDAVESILIENAGRETYAAEDEAEKRLRFLLTGTEEQVAPRLPAKGDLPPMTLALADLFDPAEDGTVLVDAHLFGRPRNDHGGIYEIAEAKRFKLEQSGTTAKVSQSMTTSGSWLGLPRAMAETKDDMPQASRSLLIFYFDLQDNRVPSRYDEYLPIPSEEIVSALERGEGLVAAKKREGGKPVIVIAAPRKAQLEAVERAFGDMAEIPWSPVSVAVKPNLTPGEIQGVVRSNFGAFRSCYESMLKRDKKAEGKVLLQFEIDGQGDIVKNTIGEGSTLKDATLDTCMLAAVADLKFAASGLATTTKVTYPIAFSP